jgi:hypothetical protein
MTQTRLRRRRLTGTTRPDPLPLDPRDPDIVRVKRRQRRARSCAGERRGLVDDDRT